MALVKYQFELFSTRLSGTMTIPDWILDEGADEVESYIVKNVTVPTLETFCDYGHIGYEPV